MLNSPHEWLCRLHGEQEARHLYVGGTNDIARRVREHKNDSLPGFTKTYQLHDLLYYEFGVDITGAIQREKTIKHWSRRWKVALIESRNPNWDDLYSTLI